MTRTPEETAAEPEARPQREAPFETLGGAEAVRRLVDRFFDAMESDPAAATIRAMHPADLDPMRARLTAFLTGWLGGPQVFFDLRPGVCIRSAHRPFAIGPAERDAWLRCMEKALDHPEVDEATRALLKAPLFQIANAFRRH